MKINKKNAHIAVVHTFFELYNTRDLAEAVVKKLKLLGTMDVELQNTKQTGFTIRCKKDAEIDTNKVNKAIASAMDHMLDAKLDEVLDIMSDKYEIVYDSDMVSVGLVESVFDVDQNGRLLTVEIDM